MLITMVVSYSNVLGIVVQTERTSLHREFFKWCKTGYPKSWSVEPVTSFHSLGWGRCLAPQKELSSGLNRDLKAIKFILRMCCQRSNKFICSCRQCAHEVLLYQVLFCIFAFPQRETRVCIFLTNLALGTAVTVSKSRVGFIFWFFFLLLPVNGRKRENYF